VGDGDQEIDACGAMKDDFSERKNAKTMCDYGPHKEN